MQIVVDKSEILSAFCESPREKSEQLESIEVVRCKLVKKDPIVASAESSPI